MLTANEQITNILRALDEHPQPELKPLVETYEQFKVRMSYLIEMHNRSHPDNIIEDLLKEEPCQ